jgi:hypothetical protein
MTSSEAAKAFARSIEDAEKLLAHFDAVLQAEQADAEVFKRAGLIMAMASWETYVKSRVIEEFTTLSQATDGSPFGKFVRRRLEEDLKRFFNPNSERTKRLILEYFDVDVTEAWRWDNYTPAQAKKTLDSLIKRRPNFVELVRVLSNPRLADVRVGVRSAPANHCYRPLPQVANGCWGTFSSPGIRVAEVNIMRIANLARFASVDTDKTREVP